VALAGNWTAEVANVAIRAGGAVTVPPRSNTSAPVPGSSPGRGAKTFEGALRGAAPFFSFDPLGFFGPFGLPASAGLELRHSSRPRPLKAICAQSVVLSRPQKLPGSAPSSEIVARTLVLRDYPVGESSCARARRTVAASHQDAVAAENRRCCVEPGVGPAFLLPPGRWRSPQR